MKMLVLTLVTALMLTGCAVADADYSAPVEEPTPAAVVVEPEPPAVLADAQIEELKKSCVMIYADDGETQVQGSAVAIGEDKYLTAYHVIADGRTNVKTSDGVELTIKDSYPEIDIAVLASTEPATPVKIGDSDSVRYGDEVIAIGSPSGEKNTVTRTNVKLLPSNIVLWGPTGIGTSGAGAFDEHGNLIGIIIAGSAVEYETQVIPINTILEKF